MLLLSRPSPALADRIDLIWSAAHGPAAPGAGFRELFPASGMSLVLRLSPSGSRAVLLGPATEKATVELAARADYLGVHFRTGQAPRLVDAAPSELTDAHADVARIGGERVEAIAERLWALPDLASRQRALEDLLRAPPPLVRDERCRRAARLLEDRGGTLRIADLADRLGVNLRTLERRFVEHLGLAPKRLARLVRLRRVLALLHEGGFGTLADLACACGYADQAHLTRDLKALIGRAPGEAGAHRARALEGAPATQVVHRVRR